MTKALARWKRCVVADTVSEIANEPGFKYPGILALLKQRVEQSPNE